MGTTIHPDGERLHVYDEQVRRMIADPDMRGDVLAVGLALAWLIREEGPVVNWKRLADTARLYPASAGPDKDLWKLKDTIGKDAPVYRIAEYCRPAGQGECEAPMIRRPGLCGHKTSIDVHETNWDDGTKSLRMFCSRHRDVADQTRRGLHARDQQFRIERGDPPQPVANHGGLLARHFPGYKWERAYTWACPWWKPPASVPTSYTTPPPTLELLITDEVELAAGDHPDLSVVHGMPVRLTSRRPGGSRRPSRPTGPRPA